MRPLKSLFKKKGDSAGLTPSASPTVNGSDPNGDGLGLPSQNSSVSSAPDSKLAPVTTPAFDEKRKPTRFILHDDGSHTHLLRNARRQEHLSRMIREIMEPATKVGGDAVSAVPDFVRSIGNSSERQQQLSLVNGLVRKVQAGHLEMGQVSGSSVLPKKPYSVVRQSSEYQNAQNDVEVKELSFATKYGKSQKIVGKGAYGTVRVTKKIDADGQAKLYAVKEFKKRSSENDEDFQRRLMSEFCIASSLHHVNIINTLDFMKDSTGGCCQVMEFCPGGDLYSLILSSGLGLKREEANCFFKQILRGVVYMHSMGVSHCDLKPENILLTQDGVCKISDFGNAECFRMAWETTVHYSRGVCGSGPYIAPEEYKDQSFDPRAVDIWAMGVVYVVMRTGAYLWREAIADKDENYTRYLKERKTPQGCAAIEGLKPSLCTYVIYSILDPVPSRRLTAKQVMNSEWCRSIRTCTGDSKVGQDPEAPSGSSRASPIASASNVQIPAASASTVQIPEASASTVQVPAASASTVQIPANALQESLAAVTISKNAAEH